MPTIEDFFPDTQEANSELTHPLLRDISHAIAIGRKFSVEIYRPRATVGLVKTKIYVHSNGDENTLAAEYDWDDELNSGLVKLGVRAKDIDNESLRFALSLRDHLKNIERRHGSSYYNAVLLDLIKESELDQFDEIKEVIKHTYHDATDKTTPNYNLCRDSIAFEISGLARDLTVSLGYSKDEAKNILPKAIAEYIDERFSVSARRQMGLLE